MTARVFECRPEPIQLPASSPRSREPDSAPPGRGFLAAALCALVLVPLAGAAEGSTGWTVATLTALGVLGLYRVVRGRARWGGLCLLTGLAILLTPGQQLAPIGPGLFVAAGQFLVLWLANRSPTGEATDGHAKSVSAAREAQQAAGFSGERYVGAVLAQELPPSYALLNGLKLPRGAGDIDHLVVGPTGIFLLETKTMAGRIVCGPDGTWSRTKLGRAGTPYAAFIGDPAAQAQRNIMAVRNTLRQHVPELFRGRGLWIEGVLVFPHPRTQLEAEHSRVPAMRLEDVNRYVCTHAPHRPLQPHEVDAVVAAVLAEAGCLSERAMQPAQAMVELALGLPLVLALLFGTVSVSRIVQAQTAVVAVAREAARAGALANTPAEAVVRMRERAQDVAPGLGLDAASVALECDVSRFTQRQGRVTATARYTVDLGPLPFVDWVPAPTVRAEHVEWVDPFRAGISLPLQEAGP